MINRQTFINDIRTRQGLAPKTGGTTVETLPKRMTYRPGVTNQRYQPGLSKMKPKLRPVPRILGM